MGAACQEWRMENSFFGYMKVSYGGGMDEERWQKLVLLP